MLLDLAPQLSRQGDKTLSNPCRAGGEAGPVVLEIGVIEAEHDRHFDDLDQASLAPFAHTMGRALICARSVRILSSSTAPVSSTRSSTELSPQKSNVPQATTPPGRETRRISAATRLTYGMASIARVETEASNEAVGYRRWHAHVGVLDGVVEVGYPMGMINACFRSAYRLAYPLARRWWAWRGHNATSIAVWFADRVLVVRHSYKPGLRLPGGGVKAGEDHRLAAIRELQEETGLIVAVADVVLLMETYGKFGKRSIFEVQLDAEPELTVDSGKSSMLASNRSIP
jgi:hypothetical protein